MTKTCSVAGCKTNYRKKVDGVLVADKDRLEKDPDYFIELMKSQLEMNNQRFNNSSEVAK